MRLLVGLCLLATLAAPLMLCACIPTRGESLTAPRTLVSPYDSAKGELLWAVAPLRNESGVSFIDVASISDHLVGAVEESQGVRAVPLSRTLAAMQALQMPGVRTPGDARRLAQALGADGIVVGSITSYDPYTPVLGISLALFAKPGAMGTQPRSVSIENLRHAAAEPTNDDGTWVDRPLALFAERMDAKNHQVLMDLQAFAEGRSRQRSALGWRRYTSSMDLYAQFVMYRGVDGLLQQEWVRTASLK